MIMARAPPEACGECVLPEFTYSAEMPPFLWPRETSDVETAVSQVLAETKSVLDAVAAVPDDSLTFAAVVSPLMHLPVYKTNPLVCQAKHMQHCSTDPQIREAASTATTAFANCKKESRKRKDVYMKVKKFSESEASADLSANDRHYVTAILEGFERNGLGLNEVDAASLKQLLDNDVEVCNAYKSNLAEDKTRIEFTAADLDGCDAEWIAEKQAASEDKKTVVLTLKYPDILPVLQSCNVSETRKRISMARESAYGNNLELVAKGVQLRKKAAKILGFDSWAHFVTKTRMSGSPEKVQEFLGGILSKAEAGGLADKERLRQLKQQHLQERGELEAASDFLRKAGANVELEAWDVSFYHALLLKRDYGVDHEAIRKYFPCPVVVEGTLAIYQDLLGLKFTELFNFDTWHLDVRLFVVHDCESGNRIGHFYLDLHPRDGKYNHAAIFHLLKRNDATMQTPVDCMLTNLPAPGADGKPALLRHDDVVTFFHEFGHIMHGLCAEGTGNSTTLAKCPRDFVEAPSQMLENWCFDESVLQKLSKHAGTGEHLPKEIIASLLNAKNVSEGLMMLRQLYLGLLDLEIHGVNPPEDATGLQDLVDRLRPKISLINNPPGCNMLRNFGHLMNQYSAAYYGYLWAEVLSADMFTSKFEKDPFDKKAGMEYRKKVLAPGGVGKIAEHLEAFLGHEPTQEPFLKSRGILKS